jgi:transposase
VGTRSTKKLKRVDSRNWSAYNHWQSDEIALACARIRALADSGVTHDWARRRALRRVARRTIVLCLLVKAYFNVSYRRLHGLLDVLRPTLGLATIPGYTTVARYGRDGHLTPTLERLFAATARPFWARERVLTIDSTGLLLQGSGAWRGDHTDEDRRDYAKIHVLSGTTTRATLAFRLTRGTWHDSTQLEALVEEVPEGAPARALVGDKAYWTRDCADAARYEGLEPFFPPKENARWVTRPGDAFERMTRHALTRPKQFARVYHRRSTSESRNATEKLLFGDRLRSRRPEARRNEALARQIVHNARLLTKRRAR